MFTLHITEVLNTRSKARHSTLSGLRKILRAVATEDYANENETIEHGLERYRSLILEVARVKKFDLAVWVEGSDSGFQKDLTDLAFLERANLLNGEMNYTDHNAYREYRLTKEGAELATRLKNG